MWWSAGSRSWACICKLDSDVELVDPEDDPRYNEYWRLYHQLLARKWRLARRGPDMVRTNSTVIAALMVQRRKPTP
jgi:malate dehydrogenase (oxaloacetate-decarboxylating)(NADP+)